MKNPADILQIAFDLIDKANSEDPNLEKVKGDELPKELIYGQRMSMVLKKFNPEASTALQLAARGQHICRWTIARGTYPMDRTGYLKWRADLKNFHAKKLSEVLSETVYDKEIIDRVAFLVQKKQLKRDPETQILEDVICLVFLEFYFEEFAVKHTDEKVIDIIQKTWRKMSENGQKTALTLSYSNQSLMLIKKALA